MLDQLRPLPSACPGQGTLFVLGFAIMACTSLCQAQYTYWDNSYSAASWNHADAWSDGVPNGARVAYFRQPSSAGQIGRKTVYVNGDSVRASGITFDGGTHVTWSGGGSLSVGRIYALASGRDTPDNRFENLTLDVASIEVESRGGGAFATRYPTNALKLTNSNTTSHAGFDVSSEPASETSQTQSSLYIEGGSFTTTLADQYGNISENSRLITSRTILNTKIVNYGLWDVYDDTTLNGVLDGLGTIHLRNSGSDGYLLLTGATDHIHQKITGVGALKIRNGHYTLLTGNDFSGGLYLLDGGQVSVSGGSRLGALNNKIHFDGGQLNVTSSANISSYSIGINGQSRLNTNSNNVTLSGDLSGSGRLEKIGAGRLTLTGDNAAFDGELLVSQGSLRAGQGDSLGNNTAVKINSAGNFTLVANEGFGSLSGSGEFTLGSHTAWLNHTGHREFSGTVVGDGRIVQDGPGTSVFSGNLSLFPGQFQLEDGELVLKGEAITSRFQSTIVAKSGTTFAFDTAGSDASVSSEITNTGAIKKLGAGVLRLTGSLAAGSSGAVQVHGGTLRSHFLPGDTLELKDGGTFETTRDLTISQITVAANSGGINTNAKTVTLADTGQGNNFGLHGSGTLRKLGSGRLHIAEGELHFDGTVAIEDGQVSLGTSYANADFRPLGSGELSVAVNTPVAIGRLSGDGRLNLNPPSVGTTASLEIGSNGSDSVFTGTILGTGTVIKEGTGTLALLGENQDSLVRLNNGTLQIGQHATGRGIVVQENATLQAGEDLNTDNATALAFPAGNSTLDTNGFRWTHAGSLSGAGTINKTGQGVLALTGTNDHGQINVHQGVLEVTNSSIGPVRLSDGTTLRAGEDMYTGNVGIGLGLGEVAIDTNGKTWEHSGTFGNFGQSALVKTGAGTLHLTGAATIASDIILRNGTLKARPQVGERLVFDGGVYSPTSNNFNWTDPMVAVNKNSVIFDTGDNTIVMNGSLRGLLIVRGGDRGNFTLGSGASISTSGAIVESGTLTVENTAAKNMYFIVGQGGVLSIPKAQTIGSIFHSSVIGAGRVELPSGTGVVRWNRSANNLPFAGDVSIGSGRELEFYGRMQGNFHLSGNSRLKFLIQNSSLRSVSGSGTIDINGHWIAAYAGPATQFSGDFVGGGSFYISNPFTFNGDATEIDAFQSSERLSGEAAFSQLRVGGYLAPGNSAGTITAEEMFLYSNSSLEIELGGLLAGIEHDQLVVESLLRLDETQLFVSLLDGYELGFGQEYLFADVRGTRQGMFANLNEGSLVGTFSGRDLFISYSAGDGNDIALFTAVPEPSTLWPLLLIGLAFSRRRYRRTA